MYTHIRGFGGEIPRTSARLLNDNMAQAAMNAKLWSGEIRPFYRPYTVERPTKTGDLKTLYLYDNEFWCHWTEDVSVVRGPVSGDTGKRTYFSGVSGGPRVFNSTTVDDSGGTDYPVLTHPLGVPTPDNSSSAFTATDTGTGGSGDDRYVNYVYTYVTAWGEEGPPSMPSNTVYCMSGELVNLTNITACPTGTNANLDKIRIYRALTGNSTATYRLVAEIAGSSTSYSDTIIDDNLEDELPSLTWIEPPSDLDGLIAHPGGFLVGFSGNEVYCSEPYLPHAWPVANSYAFPDDVVALGVYGSTIVVATRSHPYLLSGSSPETLRPEKLPARQPCLSKRGMVSGELGVIWPTPDGLYMVGSEGTGLITTDVLTKGEWTGFNPATIHAAIYDNKYIAFYTTAVVGGVTYGQGFSVDLAEPSSKFTEFDFYAHALFTDPYADTLYMATKDDDDQNIIQRWEGNSTRLPYLWRSKVFGMPPQNPAAAQVVADYNPRDLTAEEIENMEQARQDIIDANQALIDAGTTKGEGGAAMFGEFMFSASAIQAAGDIFSDESYGSFKLYADGELIHQTALTDSEPFRLPSGYLARELEVEVEGNIFIKNITLASSVTEIYKAGY